MSRVSLVANPGCSVLAAPLVQFLAVALRSEIRIAQEGVWSLRLDAPPRVAHLRLVGELGKLDCRWPDILTFTLEEKARLTARGAGAFEELRRDVAS